jgi:serine/threonine protein phosphatase PrpC
MSGSFATDIGGSAEQQDRAAILTLPAQGDPAALNGAVLSVVADGHGTHGARAAQWAVDWVAAHPTAPLNAETFRAIDEHIRTQLLAHLAATGAAHMQYGKGIYRPGLYGTRGLPIRGGTTLSIALILPDGTVHAAHVGDSDIHVFTEGGADAEGTSLMGDHTVTSRAEYDRIRALHPGAQFIMEASAVGLPKLYDRPVWVAGADGPQLNPAGPFHFSDVRNGWAAYLRASDDSEGVAMTRALGDFNLQLLAGVSTEPHCQTLPAMPPSDAGPRERVVVNASDGFWDIVHYAEAAEVIWKPENRGNSAATAAALLALAKAKTLERLGAPGDNITVSVIRVLAPRPPAPAAAAEVAVAAPAQMPGGDSLTDPALWEAAVQRYKPGDIAPLGHSPNNHQIAEGQEEMARSGAIPGTGFWYFGRGSTQKIIYRSLDGRYWNITYRRFTEDEPTHLARWRIVCVEPWYHSPFGPALP